jgi:hypothetical protein
MEYNRCMRTALFSALALSLLIAIGGCGDDESTAQTGPPGPGSGGSSSSAGGTTSTGGMGGTSSAGGSAGSGGMGGSTMMTACNGNACDLDFSGSGFGMMDGKTVHIGLTEQGQSGLVFEDSAVIQNGAFSFSETGVLQKGTSYFFAWYVDLDEDGICTAANDAKWRISLMGVQTNYVITTDYDPNTQSNLACAGFN